MNISWRHRHPVECLCGDGSLSALPDLVAGRRALLVTTPGMVRRGVVDRLKTLCPFTFRAVWTASPNPELPDLDAALRSLGDGRTDIVVGLGGGSALDSAKALAAGLDKERDWSLEAHFFGPRRSPLPSALPLVCIPTTAGTGSEATPFATIWDSGGMRKLSLDAPCLYARAAILDPSLTTTLPWRETLWGGLDTISHALESLWGAKATPVSLALAREALALSSRVLPSLRDNGGDVATRSDMQAASYMAGMAISQNRTALAHAISYPLTLRFRMPHGLACSFTLPALAKRMDAAGLWRSREDRALAERGIDALRGFGLPGLVREYTTGEEMTALVDEMFHPDRAGNFLASMSREDVVSVLHESMRG